MMKLLPQKSIFVGERMMQKVIDPLSIMVPFIEKEQSNKIEKIKAKNTNLTKIKRLCTFFEKRNQEKVKKAFYRKVSE